MYQCAGSEDRAKSSMIATDNSLRHMAPLFHTPGHASRRMYAIAYWHVKAKVVLPIGASPGREPISGADSRSSRRHCRQGAACHFVAEGEVHLAMVARVVDHRKRATWFTIKWGCA